MANHQPQSEAAINTKTVAQRRRDLDFYRGFTVAQMVAAHLLMHSAAPVRGDETFRIFFLAYAYIFSAGFLMLTGVNVDLVIEKAKKIPGFRLTRLYALTALGLFFYGWSYNLIEGSGPFISVVQAIGVGVFFAYLLARIRLPNWAMPFVAGLFFANYFLALGAQIEINPQVRSHFAWHLFAGNGEMTKEAVKSLWPSPYWFCMFGIIPSTGFVIMGLFIERLRGRKMALAASVFLILLVVSWLLPMMAYNPRTQPVIRADFRFFLQTFALFTGWLLAFRHIYPKVRESWFTKGVERFGILSLDFLVLHWIFIYLARNFTPGLDRLAFSTAQWIRCLLVLALMWFAVPAFNAWRKKLEKHRGFLRGMRLATIIFMVIAVFTSATHLTVVRMFAGAFAALAFALMYPAQRAAWRKSSMPGNPIEQKGA